MLKKHEIQLLNIFWTNSVNKALNALSKMIGKKARALNTLIRIEHLNVTPKLLNHKMVSSVTVCTKLSDDLKCVILFFSPLKDFLKLADILLKKEIDYYEALNDENMPVILELGNIINGYLESSLNNLEIKFKNKEVDLFTNPSRIIENFGFGNPYKEKIYVLLFESNFEVGADIRGKTLMLIEKNKVDKILESISKKVKIE